MEELIYLIIKLIAGAMSESKTKRPAPPPQVDRDWQQRVWEQQRRMQLAASGRPVLAPPPPPPPRRAVEVRSVQPAAAVQARIERASGHEAGAGRSSRLSQLVQPASLRRRFILTEVLRPPVSLRPPRI